MPGPTPFPPPALPLTPRELVRWVRFGEKGGLGLARAEVDRIAVGDGLMFIRGDVITVLVQLAEGLFLGYCEGVVGSFREEDISFTTKIKRAVISERTSPRRVVASAERDKTSTQRDEGYSTADHAGPSRKGSLELSSNLSTPSLGLSSNGSSELEHDARAPPTPVELELRSENTSQPATLLPRSPVHDAHLASTLRDQIATGSPPPAKFPATISPSSSATSFVEGIQIPRRSFIFPRSSTLDSLSSIRQRSTSLHSEHPPTLPLFSGRSSGSSSTGRLSIGSTTQKFETHNTPKGKSGERVMESPRSLGSSHSPVQPTTLQERRRATAKYSGDQASMSIAVPATAWQSVDGPRRTSSISRHAPILSPSSSIYSEQISHATGTPVLSPSLSASSLASPPIDPRPPYAPLSVSIPPVVRTSPSIGSLSSSTGRRVPVPSVVPTTPVTSSPHRPGWKTPPLDQPSSVWSPKSPAGLAAFFRIGRRKAEKGKGATKEVESMSYPAAEKEASTPFEAESPSLISLKGDERLFTTGRSLDYGNASIGPHAVYASSAAAQSTVSLAGDFTSAVSVDERERRWRSAMQSPAATSKKSKRVKALVQLGIPPQLRGLVWSYLSEVEQIPGEFERFCSLDRLPICDEIDRDLATTFVDHPHFAPGSTGREDLQLVIYALSNYHPGYSRGLGMIVGMFLLHGSAKSAFWIVVSMIKRAGFGRYFVPSGQAIDSTAFEQLLQETDPKLFKILVTLQIDSSLFLNPWLSTLFLDAVPETTALRLLDLYFFDSCIPFRTALAILSSCRKQLLDDKSSPTRDSLIHQLHHLDPEAMSPAKLLPLVGATKLRADKLKKVLKRAEDLVAKRK